MKKISSEMTYFQKRVFPVIWFGILGLVSVGMIVSRVTGSGPPLFVLAWPAFMAAFGYLLFRHLVLDLVDEVYDCGSSLLIKNGGKEDQIELADIINVSYTTLVNPQRVTLTLREGSRLGKEISFMPPRSARFLNPFAKSASIEDLIRRVDEARSNR